MDAISDLSSANSAGVAIFCLWILYKILALLIPKLQIRSEMVKVDSPKVSSDIQRLIVVTEIQSKAVSDHVDLTRELNGHMKDLCEVHTGTFARRADSTLRWHNSAVVEQATLDIDERTKDIERDIKQLRNGG